jgi:hypothetical protein
MSYMSETEHKQNTSARIFALHGSIAMCKRINYRPRSWPRAKCLALYRVSHMFEHDIATYVSLNWLEISKFPMNMMYPYWWTTHMQKIMSPLSIKHWRKLCQNQDLQKKLQIISSFHHNIALMHFFSSVCKCTPDLYFSTYSIVHVEALK